MAQMNSGHLIYGQAARSGLDAAEASECEENAQNSGAPWLRALASCCVFCLNLNLYSYPYPCLYLSLPITYVYI